MVDVWFNSPPRSGGGGGRGGGGGTPPGPLRPPPPPPSAGAASSTRCRLINVVGLPSGSERRQSVEWRRGSALNLIDMQREHEFPAFEPLRFACGVFDVDVVGDRQAHIHLRQLMNRPVDPPDA